MESKYKRIILKISGEALVDESNHEVLDGKKIESIAKTLKLLHDNNVEVGVVVGAGNIFRGKLSDELNIDRTDADYMGMLGTVINCVAISSCLEKMGIETRVMSAIQVNQICEPYRYKKARAHLARHIIVFFAGGTGNPYFTTDSCASLRALEMNCDAILMGKNGIDGVYDCDPKINKNAKFIKNLTYDDIIRLNLKVMDQTSIAMLKDHGIEVRIFSMKDPNNFLKVVKGEDIGSTIKEK